MALLHARLSARYFPKIFGKSNDSPLDEVAARHALQALTNSVSYSMQSILYDPLDIENLYDIAFIGK